MAWLKDEELNHVTTDYYSNLVALSDEAYLLYKLK